MNHRMLSICLIFAATIMLANCANVRAPQSANAQTAGARAGGKPAALTPVTQRKVSLSDIKAADQAYRSGAWAEAERAYRVLAEAAPEHPYPWFRLGNTYVKTNRLELAQAAYTRALARDARNAKALHNLALTNLMLTTRALERGVASLDANEPSVRLSRELLRELKRILDANDADASPSGATQPSQSTQNSAALMRTQLAATASNKERGLRLKPAKTRRLPVPSEGTGSTTLTRGLREL